MATPPARETPAAKPIRAWAEYRDGATQIARATDDEKRLLDLQDRMRQFETGIQSPPREPIAQGWRSVTTLAALLWATGAFLLMGAAMSQAKTFIIPLAGVAALGVVVTARSMTRPRYEHVLEEETKRRDVMCRLTIFWILCFFAIVLAAKITRKVLGQG